MGKHKRLLKLLTINMSCHLPIPLLDLGYCHYAVNLKNELFPTVGIVDIPFSSDCRDMFSEQIHTATASVVNNSLRSMEKGMSTIMTIGKSSHYKNTKTSQHIPT